MYKTKIEYKKFLYCRSNSYIFSNNKITTSKPNKKEQAKHSRTLGPKLEKDHSIQDKFHAKILHAFISMSKRSINLQDLIFFQKYLAIKVPFLGIWSQASLRNKYMQTLFEQASPLKILQSKKNSNLGNISSTFFNRTLELFLTKFEIWIFENA